MSTNLVEPERLHTILSMCLEWRRSKATRPKAHARARAPTPKHVYVWTHTHTHTQKYVMLIAFPQHSGFANAPQCYVIRTLPVVLPDILYMDRNMWLCYSKWTAVLCRKSTYLSTLVTWHNGMKTNWQTRFLVYCAVLYSHALRWHDATLRILTYWLHTGN